MTGTSPLVVQRGYRSRANGDTVTLDSTDWGGRAQDTDWSQDVDEVFRLRLLLSDTVASTKTSNYTFGLEFQINGGGFSAVTGTSAVQPVTSAQFTDDDNITTAQITGGQNTFVTGRGDTNGAAPTAGNITLGNGNDHTVGEFALTIDSAQVANGDLVQIRATATDGAPEQTPTITVVEGGTSNNVTHLAASATDTGGSHAKSAGRAHSAALATGTGGIHAATHGAVVAHAGASATATGGAQAKSVGRIHSAGLLTETGGSHAKSVAKGHASGLATLTGGVHAAGVGGATTGTITVTIA